MTHPKKPKSITYMQVLNQLELYSAEELIAELYKRNLGVFNRSLPFKYSPKDENN